MNIQHVLKGIPNLSDEKIESIFESGVLCNWWRNQCPSPIHAKDIAKRLNQDHLDWHQSRYYEKHPSYASGAFHEHTPFISTTAGTVEVDYVHQTNRLTPAWTQALAFATNNWQTDGVIVHAYVFVLDKKAVELEQFAEELRDLHVFHRFSPFHYEGEVTAKIRIPIAQIKCIDIFDVTKVNEQLRNHQRPTGNRRDNPNYQPPERFMNIRETIE